MAKTNMEYNSEQERKRRLAAQQGALDSMQPAVIDDSRVRQAIVRTPKPGFTRPVNPVPRTQPTPPPTKINQPAKSQPDFTQPPAWWMQPPSWWNKSQPTSSPAPKPTPPSTTRPAPQPRQPTPPSQGRPIQPPAIGGQPVPPRAGIPLPPVAKKKPIRTPGMVYKAY